MVLSKYILTAWNSVKIKIRGPNLPSDEGTNKTVQFKNRLYSDSKVVISGAIFPDSDGLAVEVGPKFGAASSHSVKLAA